MNQMIKSTANVGNCEGGEQYKYTRPIAVQGYHYVNSVLNDQTYRIHCCDCKGVKDVESPPRVIITVSIISYLAMLSMKFWVIDQ